MTAIEVQNVWHDDNAGDSAIADVCIQTARVAWPGAQITARTMLSCRDVKYDGWHRHLARSHPDVDFSPAMFGEPATVGRFRRLRAVFSLIRDLPLLVSWMPTARRRAAKKRIAAVDHLVIVGGSDLFALRSGGLRAELRLRRLTEACLIARSLGVPYSLWGHTLGPFETETSRRRIKRVLDGAADVVVREDVSMRLANELAPSASVRRLPDLAFALRSDEEALRAGGAPTRYCVLVPRLPLVESTSERRERVVREFATLARDLLDRDFVDEVIVVAQVIGPSVLEDDRRVSKMIVAAADRANVRMMAASEDGLSPRALRSLFSKAEFCVAVRLHGAILSMSSGTPAFAISYFTAKTEGVLRAMGAEDSWCTLDDFTSSRVLDWLQGVSLASRRSALTALAHDAREALAALAGDGHA